MYLHNVLTAICAGSSYYYTLIMSYATRHVVISITKLVSTLLHLLHYLYTIYSISLERLGVLLGAKKD